MASSEIQKLVEKLTPMDDNFFHKLAENKGFCEELLQTVMENKNLRLIEATPHKSIRNIKGRSVELDLFCVDAEKDNFDVEVQKKNDDDHQRRVRYNGSNMDTYLAEKGIKFKQIPNCYVIYISKKDFFGKGKTVYHVDRVLRETKEVVDNGFHEIYLNTKIDDNSELAELMKIYKSRKIPENDKFPKTCEAIRNLKVGRRSEGMSDLVERYARKKAKEAAARATEKAERKAEKVAKEAEKAAKEEERNMVIRMIKNGKLTLEEIVEIVPSVSLEEVIQLKESVLQVS